MRREWNEKEWNMGNVYLVEIMNKKDLVVKLENRMKNSKLLAKNF